MGINLVSDRAKVLGLETLIETAAVDEYVFMRDAYLQKRTSDMAEGTVTIGKQSGVSETSSGDSEPEPTSPNLAPSNNSKTPIKTGGNALDILQGPPE